MSKITFKEQDFTEIPGENYKPKFLHSSDAIKVLQVNIAAGSEIPAHKSPEAVLMVLEGSGSVVFDDETVEVSEGSIVILPPGQDHAVKAETNLRVIVTVSAEEKKGSAEDAE